MEPASDPVPTPGWLGRVQGLVRQWRLAWSTETVAAPGHPSAQPSPPDFSIHAAPPPSVGPPRNPSPAARLLRPPCVLVVDDNPANLELASAALWDLGVGPVLAADGAEAVALALELRPDLVLMDLQMPVLDGIEATRQIRRFERQHGRARVPVVAFTSNMQAADTQRLLLCGFDGMLQKPCEEPALLECLQRWCPPIAHVNGRQGTGPA